MAGFYPCTQEPAPNCDENRRKASPHRREILHDDGTIAVYGHLHWDSIRVRIGAHVVRGQYIADSGNTGITSGPHLHFAVVRNEGGTPVSVPIQFAGIAGVAVTPATQMSLTAY